MIDKLKISQKIVTALEQNSLKHEVHHFPSEAMMIDIWQGNVFYNIQLDEQMLGFSKMGMDEEPAFCTLPDISFDNEKDFVFAFEEALKIKLDQNP